MVPSYITLCSDTESRYLLCVFIIIFECGKSIVLDHDLLYIFDIVL